MGCYFIKRKRLNQTLKFYMDHVLTSTHFVVPITGGNVGRTNFVELLAVIQA